MIASRMPLVSIFALSTLSFFATILPVCAERHLKLGACEYGDPRAVAAAGLATRNGKTVISLTANFLGDAGFDVRPLRNGVPARRLVEKTTSMVFDFNGNKPRSSFSLFVAIDYVRNGTELKATQVSFGDSNDFPLQRQADGTYLATVTLKGLQKNFIGADDEITKFTLDYRNADNTNPDFVNTIYVSDVKFLGDTLPIIVKDGKAGCEIFR